MKILIGCEFSGTVREAFAALGHDAWSCDILPTERPGKHIQGDVLEVIHDGWDMAIFHPPCTYLTNSGVRWLYGKDGKARDEQRWENMREGAEFFKALLNAPIPRIAVENPVMHKYAKNIIGADYAQTIQPFQFGHPESKRTALWLKNLPMLRPTNILEKQGHWQNQTASGQNKLAPGADRWKERSRTYEGIALAMSFQWGNLGIIPTQRSLFELLERIPA